MKVPNQMAIVSEALGLCTLYEYLSNKVESWLNPDRKAYIQTIFDHLSTCFDSEWKSQRPDPEFPKFALVIFLKSESWKTIDDKIISLEMIASSDLKASINDWKQQIKAIRDKHADLRIVNTFVKDREEFLNKSNTFNTLSLATLDKTGTDSEKARTQELIKRAKEDQQQGLITIAKTQRELGNLRQQLWTNIFETKNKTSFSTEEQEKYESLCSLLKNRATHFQVCFESDQVELDEVKLIFKCYTPPESINKKVMHSQAQSILQNAAVKAVVIYEGAGSLHPDDNVKKQPQGTHHRGYTIYYRVECKVMPGNETPKLNTKTQTQSEVKKTRYQGEIEDLSQAVLNLLPPIPEGALPPTPEGENSI